MSSEQHKQIVKDLLFEREELKRELQAIQVELAARGHAFSELGKRLSSTNPDAITIDTSQVYLTKHAFAEKVASFPNELFDLQKAAGLADQLRAQQRRLTEVIEQLRNLGYGQ